MTLLRSVKYFFPTFFDLPTSKSAKLFDYLLRFYFIFNCIKLDIFNRNLLFVELHFHPCIDLKSIIFYFSCDY